MEYKLEGGFKYPDSQDLATKTIEFIHKRYGVNITKKGRKRRLVELRALFYKVMIEHTKGESLEAVGKAVKVHHATVIHHRKNIEKYFKDNSRLYGDYIDIINNVILKEDNKHLVEDKESDEIKKDLILMLQDKVESIKRLESEKEKLTAINMKLRIELEKTKSLKSRESIDIKILEAKIKELELEVKESRKENKSIWNDFKKSKGIYGKVLR